MKVDKQGCLKEPVVTFQIVSRQLTPAQTDAGKRLFKKLIARAQSVVNKASPEESSHWKR